MPGTLSRLTTYRQTQTNPLPLSLLQDRSHSALPSPIHSSAPAAIDPEQTSTDPEHRQRISRHAIPVAGVVQRLQSLQQSLVAVAAGGAHGPKPRHRGSEYHRGQYLDSAFEADGKLVGAEPEKVRGKCVGHCWV